MAFKKEKITLGDNTFTMKVGALRRQLGVKEVGRANIVRLAKVPVGDRFEWKGKQRTMTELLKRRVVLAKTLTKPKKK